MRPVTAAFLRAVRGSHTAVFRARVCETYQNGVQPDGIELAITGGDVSFSADAVVRASLDLTVDGTDAWSSRAGGLLTPYGNEIYVERGIQFGNGVTEWVGLGYYRITDTEQEDAPDGPIRIAGQDRMSGLVDARLLAPIQFLADATVGDIFDQLVTEVYPDVDIHFADAGVASETIGRSVVCEVERAEFLIDLARAYSQVVYFDHRGRLVIAPVPDSTEPVWAVTAGRNGVLISAARSLSRAGVYNGVVATGEGADTAEPVRGVALDENPNSPTYWHGKFGKKPRFYSSPFLTTDGQADSAANALLETSRGLPYSMSLKAVPNPAPEVLDPVLVKYSDKHGREIHVFGSMTIPLTVDPPITATTLDRSGEGIVTGAFADEV